MTGASAKNILNELKAQRDSKLARKIENDRFIENIMTMKSPVTRFSETAFRNLVDHIEITEKGKIMVIYKNGLIF